MAETVTITLSDEVANRAKETARLTGRSLEDVLTDWLDQMLAQADEDFSDMLVAANSSLSFWDNPMDDEDWNNA